MTVGEKSQLLLKGRDVMLAIWSIWFGKVPSDRDLKDEILKG